MDSKEYQVSFDLEEVHWWFRGQRYLLNMFLTKYFNGRKDLNILDVGCGTGYNLTVLKDFGTVHGIDIAPEAREFCAKRNHEIVICDVMNIPFPHNHFDLVTSLGVFYHRNVTDDLKGMREIHRILKPEGRLFFFDSAMSCLSGNNDIVFHSIRRYSTQDLKNKLAQAGFRIDYLGYVNMVYFPVTYLKRRLEKLLGTEPKSEATPLWGLLNHVLYFVYKLDLYLLRYIKYPFGINIMSHAGK